MRVLDPNDEGDGALEIGRVLITLRRYGVHFQDTQTGIRLHRGDCVFVIVMLERVPRYVVHDLARKFDVPALEFYAPGAQDEDIGPPT